MIVAVPPCWQAPEFKPRGGAQQPRKVAAPLVEQLGAEMFKVEKQSYSRGAWRVLDADGEQVYRREIFDHPMLGRMAIAGPVCFDRKRDAVAWVAAEVERVEAAAAAA